MARLTKQARRAAALKGWRNRTRKAPKRRNRERDYEPAYYLYFDNGKTAFSGPWRKSQAEKLVAKRRSEGYKVHMKAGQWPGKTIRELTHFQEPKLNPPSGFIPCKAVKITRNKGKVEVRIRK